MSLQKKAFDLQLYSATKQLFKAVAAGKNVVVYGPPGCGKDILLRDNELLLQKYEYLYLNLESKVQLNKVLNKTGLFIACSHYLQQRKLCLPRDDTHEIFLPLSLGEHTNKLKYKE